MKYFFPVLIVAICAAVYLRMEEPQTWNNYLNALKAPDDSSSSSPDSTGTAASQVEPTPPPAPTTPPTTSEVISPDSTNFMNPDHVKPVEQPAQRPIPTNPPSTNPPSTNAPSTNSTQ